MRQQTEDTSALPLRGAAYTRNRVILAPMSGVTDAPFRDAVMHLGAGLAVSEMIASRQLVCEAQDELRRLRRGGCGAHVVQIAGCEPEWMRLAAKIAEDAGADVIDINMGCPAKKVINSYSGSALMRDLDKAEELIAATLEGTRKPVTLKMRLGWDWAEVNAPDLAQRAERLGVALVTVHGRTRNQFYKGTADWNAVKAVKQSVTIPVVVNGDIDTPERAVTAMKISGADAVMVGRAALGRPWLLGQIADHLSGRQPQPEPIGEALVEVVLAHFHAVLEHYGAELGIRVFRKHLAAYIEQAMSPPLAASWRARLLTETDAAAAERGIREWAQATSAQNIRKAA